MRTCVHSVCMVMLIIFSYNLVLGQERTNYALIIGTDTYDHWEDLIGPNQNGPVKDANMVGSDLKNLFGFSTKIAENPTKEDFENTISEYQNKDYGSLDQLLIWIGGHSFKYPGSEYGFLILKDSDATDSTTWISFGALAGMLKEIEVNHIFLIIDVKSNGRIPEYIAGTRVSPTTRSQSEYLQYKLEKKFYRFLMSTGTGYTVTSSGSDFAYKVLEALRTMNSYKINTHTDLLDKVEDLKDLPQIGTFSDQDESDAGFIFEAVEK